MSLKEHQDYNKEIDRLKYTVNYVENAINAAKESKKRLRADIKEAFVDLDPTDSSLSYVRILTNAKFLDMIEKNYDGLVRAQKKPYFCRIDFRMEDTSKPSELYIGKTSLYRVEDEAPLIVDWRSPVASVYYDGRLGEVTYNTPTGQAIGELFLKRQYIINDGNLENIMDVDITTTDTFLQAALGENKDNKLKDIVSTIQAEQNEIIRADIARPLIVQGVAGSGKTTIALHRIAYLIYTYEQTFDPDNFLIIAPNRLFLNYISEVLPELGVEQVKQTTFIDLAYDLSAITYKLASPDEKLVKLVKSKNYNSEGADALKKVSEFKGSLEFKELIDIYVEGLKQDFAPEQNFCLGEYTIFTAAEIKKMLLQDFSYLPLYKRLDELKKALTNKLKRDRVNIIKEVEAYYDKQIGRLRDTMVPTEERRLKIVELIEKRDDKVESLKKTSKTSVKKYLSLYVKSDVMSYYKDLVTRSENIDKFGDKFDSEFIDFMTQNTSEYMSKKRIEFEDLTAILYLKYKIFGFEKKMSIKYIVIDEAQDFSVFQIYVLKEIFSTELFTILGDLAQGIHSYRGTKDWNDIIESVFAHGKCRYLTLQQSYRTTIEIMNMANKVLEISKMPGTIFARPVVRHGDEPRIYRFDSKDKLVEELENKILSFKKEKYSTIAVICKTEDECKTINVMLDKKGSIKAKQLSSEDIKYEGGIIIVPSYIAKGLEFDAVIITLLDEDYSADELDIKLLYVAMTRALHKLDILCVGNTLSILGL
jgi:DNA helicase-2/ATP-dependent DNA helicase PcrA